MPRLLNPLSDNSRRAFTQGPLVLAPAAAVRHWPRTLAIATAALAIGAAATQWIWLGRIGQVQQQAASVAELQQLRQDLERASLTHRMSAAHSEELERQVDALNQRLRERDEELAFFRKSRGAAR
jgi:hypothetical protein